MAMLNNTTLRRLSKLKRLNSVWEGARRPLPRKSYAHNDGSNVLQMHQNEEIPECILWVDGSMGMVRSMDVVEASAGKDAFTRALIQAIERPQGPAQPALPQKILVADRELQFYLRGILQGLDIAVEYAETLPLINEIFTNMLEHTSTAPPLLPPALAHQLLQCSAQLWKSTLWEHLMDHQVISIELNCWDVERLFAVVLGNHGLEEGVLFYRSYASLVQFRQRLVDGQDEEDQMEETFYGQDCLFNLFESEENMGESDIRFFEMHGWKFQDLYPVFGSLHPLEGGRSHLYEEEALALMVAISAFNEFYKQHGDKFKNDQFPECRGDYTIASPQGSHQIVVQTMPELAQELEDLESDDVESRILTDLLPESAIIKLVDTPWTAISFLRSLPHCQLGELKPPKKNANIPTLMFQTSRPKANQLIKDIQERGGIKGLVHNSGMSPDGEPFAVLLLVMGNGELQVILDFPMDTSEWAKYFLSWKKRCQSFDNRCIVTIAMGISRAKGKPEPSHFMACYTIELIPPEELGLGVLSAHEVFDLEF